MITKAAGLPMNIDKSFCRYKFYLDDKFTQTEEIAGTINPTFHHEKKFSFKTATKQVYNYFYLIQIIRYRSCINISRHLEAFFIFSENSTFHVNCSLRPTKALKYRSAKTHNMHIMGLGTPILQGLGRSKFMLDSVIFCADESEQAVWT